MKKLILGLCLTVGVSASVYAGNGMVKNNMIVENKVLNSDCIIVTVVVVYDSCNNIVGKTVVPTGGTGEECNGAENGIKTNETCVSVPGCKVIKSLTQN